MDIRSAIIIAIGISIAGIGYGLAQQSKPNAINGCIFRSAPGTLTDGQSTVLTCDSTGKLRVTTSF